MAREVPGNVVDSNGHAAKFTYDGGAAVGLDLHPAQNHGITPRVEKLKAASGAASFRTRRTGWERPEDAQATGGASDNPEAEERRPSR